jgi:hypothetical protein
LPFSESGAAFPQAWFRISHQRAILQRSSFGLEMAMVRGCTDRGDGAWGEHCCRLFAVTGNLALDVRYRAILYFPLSGVSNSTIRINHGAVWVYHCGCNGVSAIFLAFLAMRRQRSFAGDCAC